MDWGVTAAQLWPILTAFLAERDKIKERRDSQSAHYRSATAELVQELALTDHKLKRTISMNRRAYLLHIIIFIYFDMFLA